MSYQGENGWISMYIFLPNSTQTAIDELLTQLTPDILDDILSGQYQYKRDVYVEVPRLSFQKTFKFKPVRGKMIFSLDLAEVCI